jgi:hypothetical protein
VVETKTVTPCLRSLQDGAYSFFSVSSSQPSADTSIGLAKLELGSSLKIGTAETGDLQFSNVVVTRYGTSLHVRGTIKNLDSTMLTDPNICAVVYTSGGNVVVVGQYTSMPSLIHNESDTFDFHVTVPSSTSTVDHVDMWADGLKNDVPIVPESLLNRSVTACSATVTPTPTGSATPTPTNTGTATNTATPTSTVTPGGPTVTDTAVPTNTFTATATSTPVCNDP